MAIEGLKNIYGIPTVEKKQKAGLNKRKKQKKSTKKGNKEEGEEQKVKEGRVDIRI